VCNECEYEYIWTYGGNIFDPDDPSKVNIESPDSVAGFATAWSMLVDDVAPRAVTTYKEDESQGAFTNGDAVFLRTVSVVTRRRHR